MSVGRFAPSPSGRLHVGNLRTALVAWLASRSAGSEFLLRFEDLDTAAVREEHYRSQREDLVALGLDWDEPVISQSERRDVYLDALGELEASDLVYPCFCSRKEIREAASAPNLAHAGHQYPGTCRDLSSAGRAERALTRPPALRLRAAGQTRAFTDLVMGDQEFTVDDFVVQRNDGTPAYHLVVVVDDAAQNIELVVRADDLLESTARHLLLYELLNLGPPAHGHVPLVLAPNGDRLAKRHGSVNLDDRAAAGETPRQVLAYLAMTLGLCSESEAESASIDGDPLTAPALIGRFSFDALPREPLLLPEEYLQPEVG